MADFNGQKILVVEDNFMSMKLMEVHLHRANLEMVHALDGAAALEAFEKDTDIKVVIMDIQLPGMNGLDVTRRIREMNHEVPIIATTGNVFEDDRIACMDAGCSYFLKKPINFTELFKILEHYFQS